MNHLELFAGIGGFRRALDLLTEDGVMNFDTIGYSEIDKNALRTYTINYQTQGEIALGDIVQFTSNNDNINALPHFDLLTGGFPCQTFSMMGQQAGFQEDRGQMFFRIMDIVDVKHPNYILLENVKNLTTHDKGRTLARILKELNDRHYIVHYDVFNSSDYGLPQTRNRVIIFARNEEEGEFEFSERNVRAHFEANLRNNCGLNFYNSTIDILDREVDFKYYLSERIKPTILSDGSAKFKSNSDIDKIIARPLTATMNKMHRACQDNYYSDIYIQSRGVDRPSTRMSKEELAQIAIRKLTPQEAFKLQGFPAFFANNAKEGNVSDGALYKQAGNAVSVNTIYSIFHYLITNLIIHE